MTWDLKLFCLVKIFLRFIQLMDEGQIFGRDFFPSQDYFGSKDFGDSRERSEVALDLTEDS